MVDPRLVEHFIEHGWARLEGAFSARAAAPLAARALERWKSLPAQGKPSGSPLGDTLPHESNVLIKDLAPRAWELVCALAGGVEGLGEAPRWSDGFVVQPPSSHPWRAPALEGFGWHIDGPFEPPRRIDDAAFALNLYALWSDVAPMGGGTFFAPGALPGVARLLDSSPAGVPKDRIPLKEIIARCDDPEYFEFHGPAGTVLVTLSLIPHAPSWNSTPSPRLLAVRIVPFARALTGYRDRPSNPVEAALRRAVEKGAAAP